MKSTTLPPPHESAVVLRRAYFDCRYGQLHVHQAIPPGGGFDEHTTLLCLPAPHSSAAVFLPLLTPLGGDRSVFAIDAPGAGQSDAAATDETSALAAVVVDFLQNMRIRRAHVLADGAAAAAVALALAQAAGRITRVALCAADAAAAKQCQGPGVTLCQLVSTVAELASAAPAAQAQRVRLREFLDLAAA
jgi:pimeloyl-ACP methyl ester carboxylesterase